MGRSGLLGAGLLIGLGLDCAGAPRSSGDADDDLTALEPVARELPAASKPAAAEDALLSHREPEAPPPGAPPGTRYAALTHEACAAELASRSIVHEALPPRLGIASPVRLHGPLSGVSFRTLWPEPERARTSFEIIDCRLVLALDDFAKLLRAHGIIDVMFFSAYRPPPAGWKESASTAGVHRHEAGLAIDIGYFGKADHTALNVERDFMPRSPLEHERICAPAPPPKDATPEAIELRRIACEAAAAQLFHVTLTPAYDSVHRDHFHLELAPDKTDFVAR